VILVEFDHQSGIIYDNDTPSRDHIHTVVRTPNGNDYGKDLLRQHYAEHDHSPSNDGPRPANSVIRLTRELIAPLDQFAWPPHLQLAAVFRR